MERQRRPGRQQSGGRPRDAGRSHPGESSAHRSGVAGAAGPRRRLAQQLVAGQAGVPRTTVRVQDSKLRRPSRRPEPVASDAHLGPLSHHVPPKPDPRPPAQLEPESGHLGQDADQRGGQAGRLEDQQPNAGSTGERREAVDPLP